MTALIARYPVAAYIVIAFAISWVLTFLLSISLLFGLLALFGPAVAAIIASRADGTFSVLRVRITDWRHGLGWYALAFGIPFVVAGIGRLVLMVTGGAPTGLGTISAIELVIFVLVIGEEIGWRSFLQPRLRARMGLLVAGVATGIVWSLWHLAAYLAPEQGLIAFLRFAWWVIPLAVVMGIIAEGTRFSAIVATVMHGAANISIPILLPGIAREWWLIATGIIYWVVAAVLLVALRARFARATPAAPVSAP
jgi:membrane protease YdiL (CAAX protease family)